MAASSSGALHECRRWHEDAARGRLKCSSALQSLRMGASSTAVPAPNRLPSGRPVCLFPSLTLLGVDALCA